VTGVDYGKEFKLGAAKVSFHSAGHILGSAQVRVEVDGKVWVASGDYKREKDPTCDPFEVVPCDVFITEATFGTPGFQWQGNSNLGEEIFDWWLRNEKRGVNSVLYAYSLGKAQRVLGELAYLAHKPIYTSQNVTELSQCYRNEGVKLAETNCLSEVRSRRPLKGELIVTPPGGGRDALVPILGTYETAFASGWMAQGNRGYDRGFQMSDHADWNALIRTIKETQAKRVYVQHRGEGALVKYLKKQLGIEAYPEEALHPEFQKHHPLQLALFDGAVQYDTKISS